MLLVKKPNNKPIEVTLPLSSKLVGGGRYFLVDSDISLFTTDQVKEYGVVSITNAQLISDLQRMDYDVWEGQVRRLTTGPNPWSDPLTGSDLESWVRGAKYLSKIGAAASINAQYQITSTAESGLEQSSWDQQLQEARSVVADNNASSPLLDVLAPIRGLSVLEYAQNVIAANERHIAERDRLLVELKTTYQMIDNVTSAVELKNLGWI